MCYQALDDGDSNVVSWDRGVDHFQVWSGNNGMKYRSPLVFQITANHCSPDDAKQKFTPVFA